jgi:hypothetical protein
MNQQAGFAQRIVARRVSEGNCRFPRLHVLLLVTITVTAITTPPANGGPLPDPVESARSSLSNKGSFPWYDSETDELKRIDVSLPNDDSAANRTSTWEGTAQKQTTTNTGGKWNPNWSFGDIIWQMLTAMAWAILLALLGFLVYLMIRAFLRNESRMADSEDMRTSRDATSDVDRVEQLPFQIKRPQSDLLGEARRQYEAGNYSEAVIYYFSYQLVQLDRHHWIRLMKGKTNRQYLREVRRAPTLHSLLEYTMLAFEDVFFGHHPVSRERFEACWKRLDDFHQNVVQAPA